MIYLKKLNNDISEVQVLYFETFSFICCAILYRSYR